MALDAQTVTQMVDTVMARPRGERLMLLALSSATARASTRGSSRACDPQGFIRARIDGRLHELDDPIALDPKRKHSIEAVVDRFRVRDDLALRLAESFETALALVRRPRRGRADGWRRRRRRRPCRRRPRPCRRRPRPRRRRPRPASQTAATRVADGRDVVFSARFTCHVCGYAIPELEPRIFSFNNPAGACQRCDGLGVRTFFDPFPDRRPSRAEPARRGGPAAGTAATSITSRWSSHSPRTSASTSTLRFAICLPRCAASSSREAAPRSSGSRSAPIGVGTTAASIRSKA